MRASLLALALFGCGEDAPETPEEPPQATALEVEQPTDRKGLVQVPGEWETPFEDPANIDELGAAWPEIAELRPSEQTLLVRILNVVPSACVPCEGKPLARCAIAPPVGCENVRPLVRRAVRLVQTHEPPEKVRAAVSYADIWVPVPADRPSLLDPTGGVRIEVWVDPTSPFSGPTLESVRKLPKSGVGLVLRYLPEADRASAEALARGAIAAGHQGMGLEFLEAAETWRSGDKDARRSRSDPFADDGLDAVAASLVASGLNVARWHTDMQGAAVSAQLADDAQLARAIGVRSVPTWFIDGYRLRGNQSDLALGRLVGLALEDAEADAGRAGGG